MSFLQASLSLEAGHQLGADAGQMLLAEYMLDVLLMPAEALVSRTMARKVTLITLSQLQAGDDAAACHVSYASVHPCPHSGLTRGTSLSL